MEVSTSIAIYSGNPELQDRAEIYRADNRVLLVIADGAGGISGGAQAAEFLMRVVRESVASLATPEACGQLLSQIDQGLLDARDCGETTGLLAIVEPGRVFGASVGDSIAWMFSSNGRVELTGGQRRKPFLGSGGAFCCPFSSAMRDGTIVVATDGLWKYTGLESIEKIVRAAGSASLANKLSELVRLRSGTFADDVAIVTCLVSS